MAQVPAAAEVPRMAARGGRTMTTEGRRRKEGTVAGAGRLEGCANERLVASGESLLIVWCPPGILGLWLLQAAVTAATPVASAPAPLRVLQGGCNWIGAAGEAVPPQMVK